MAAGKSTYASKAVLDYLLRGDPVYVGLFTVAPSDAGGGTEVAGNAYVRQLVTFSAPSDDSPSATTNSADILFPLQTPGGYGEIVAFGVFDAESAGHLLYWNTCTHKTYEAQDQARIPAGDLDITED